MRGKSKTGSHVQCKHIPHLATELLQARYLDLNMALPIFLHLCPYVSQGLCVLHFQVKQSGSWHSCLQNIAVHCACCHLANCSPKISDMCKHGTCLNRKLDQCAGDLLILKDHHVCLCWIAPRKQLSCFLLIPCLLTDYFNISHFCHYIYFVVSCLSWPYSCKLWHFSISFMISIFLTYLLKTDIYQAPMEVRRLLMFVVALPLLSVTSFGPSHSERDAIC